MGTEATRSLIKQAKVDLWLKGALNRAVSRQAIAIAAVECSASLKSTKRKMVLESFNNLKFGILIRFQAEILYIGNIVD